ncbi:MAG TPA: alpha/beta hydrolase [Stellaceae bacterium]|nr:alpha/beta hydrolase [Stellaceae bacterium]
MIEKTLDCPGPPAHRLAYYEWAGPKGAGTVLCLHGLTRNGRDFDTLAEALASDFRVVCPDMAGRGRSQWLDDPMLYAYPLYLADMAALIAALGVQSLDLVGTSMGGNIGMLWAAQQGSPIRKLVMNDIGPLIAKQGLKRIRRYAGLDPSFEDLAALEAGLRKVFAAFGPLTDEVWRQMAEHSARHSPDGRLGLAYDPKIAAPFKKGWFVRNIDLWQYYDAVTCPVLVLRGAESDILRAADAQAMTRRGPRARLIEFPGIGHAPSLTAPDQIKAVRDFLLGHA